MEYIGMVYHKIMFIGYLLYPQHYTSLILILLTQSSQKEIKTIKKNLEKE